MNKSLDHPEQQSLNLLPVEHADKHQCICEMKVSRTRRYSENTVVAVVRDVTERHRRFEAEQRATRDMHTASRFTRHEVKNGLLSGIELTRSLRQSVSSIVKASPADEAEKLARDQVDSFINELDRMLHSVMNTVGSFCFTGLVGNLVLTLTLYSLSRSMVTGFVRSYGS